MFLLKLYISKTIFGFELLKSLKTTVTFGVFVKTTVKNNSRSFNHKILNLRVLFLFLFLSVKTIVALTGALQQL